MAKWMNGKTKECTYVRRGINTSVIRVLPLEQIFNTLKHSGNYM
jgi:hypothetical protein